VGPAFETVGAEQLRRFKSDPANRSACLWHRSPFALEHASTIPGELRIGVAGVGVASAQVGVQPAGGHGVVCQPVFGGEMSAGGASANSRENDAVTCGTRRWKYAMTTWRASMPKVACMAGSSSR